MYYELIDPVTQEIVGRYPTHAQAIDAAIARGMQRQGYMVVPQADN